VHSPEHAPTEAATPAKTAQPAAPLVDVADMRRHYTAAGLTEGELAEEPMDQFARWLAEAVGAGVDEPNAMVVSTADAEGQPSSRTVLLKGYDRRGFVFYSNYGSRKGGELAANPRVSLLFLWHPLARQVIVTGLAERVPAAETESYFHRRPHGSQLGAWASDQSRPAAGREALEQRYAELERRYPPDAPVPVPPFWGGYRVTPNAIEFWQGRANRLHDRLRYRRAALEPGWSVERLQP
jgi:pyridoxamine 5'-phosphate oxidase